MAEDIALHTASKPIEHNRTTSPPESSPATRGHCRTVTVDQLVTLDHWMEDIEEQELATDT